MNIMSDNLEISPPTILQHFERVYRPNKLAGGSHSTIRQYRASIKNFDRFLASLGINRESELCDLRDELLNQAPHWLVKVRGLRPHSALKMQDNLLAIWRFLKEKYYVPHSPNVKLIDVPELIPIAWTKEELRRLWQACMKQEGYYRGVPRSLWWHALHSVIWDTGERIQAVMSCEWSDVDLKGRWLLVKAEYRKGKKADKIFRLHPDTVLLLRAIREPEREKIFPLPGGNMFNLYNHYKAMLKGARLPYDRKHMFHCMRKSTASWLEVAGGNATSQLGHSSRKTTLSYLDPRIVKQTHASDVLFRPNPQKKAG
jgi:integrase